MNRFELQPAGCRQFRKASREAIKEYFVSFAPRERRAKWIRKNNPYRHDCVGQYSRDLKNNAVSHEKMVEYVAASGPAHVIDGWSFVGRAIQALLRRDSYAAVHFGYYAELRGAMALLACEGVGILDKGHPIIASSTQTDRLQKCRRKNNGGWETNWAGTHAVIVPCLRYWSTLRRAAELLDSIVNPAGVSLSAWLAACGAHARTQAIAKSWFTTWGLDLTQIDTDHDARNLASYRPSEFRRPSPIEIRNLGTFLRDLWTLFEPAPNMKFLNLEAHLLRLALRRPGITQPTAQQIQGLGLAQDEAERWAGVLAANQRPIPFDEAPQVSAIESDRCPIRVISRAALLLYISTRAAGLHLADAGYTRDDLDFWWRQFGVDRGLWDETAVPDDPRDAWADIRDRLADIDRTLVANPTGLNGWRQAMGFPLDHLGAWEIVAVWGLVP